MNPAPPLTAYADLSLPPSIAINHINVSLAAGSTVNVTLPWNTTGSSYGNYAISAIATPVTNETSTVDDTPSGGTVLVAIPGDIEGDFHVTLGILSGWLLRMVRGLAL